MKINELLHTEYPFIQGGMANIATGAFAAAVSNAGGLGLIGAGGMDAGMLRENIRICKELTTKPFGVNLMLMNPQVDEMAEIVVDEGVKIVTTGAGSPAKYISRWKEYGMIIMPVVASTALAKKMESLGVDAVIAEGTESGGHVGEMTTMALIPQIVDAVSIPVVAAGGIADGRQLTAAFALGASGVQLGTCLLVAEECPIHENYKNALLKAKDNGTIVTGRIAGTPVRILKNAMAREYVKQEKRGADKMELEKFMLKAKDNGTIVTGRIAGTPVRILKNAMAREYVKQEKRGADKMELEKFTLGSLRRAVFDGDVKNGSLMAGQVSGQLEEIRPIRAIFEEMYDGYRQTVGKLCAKQ